MPPKAAALQQQPSGYFLVAGLFLRCLAIVYFIAFASLHGQILGLAGSDGIVPFADILEIAAAKDGPGAWLQLPSLFWLDASDQTLKIATLAGCVGALLLFVNAWPRLVAIALFLLYLSLFHAAQPFMNFQWDYLLLEAGFLAIFLPDCHKVTVWLYRWLLFRLRFMSGLSKLVSMDPSWSGLTAVGLYFQVQPLPHTGSWYAAHLPAWMHSGATFLVLMLELIVPFLMFMSRPYRHFAAWVTIAMQLIIMATGNHNFFNLLTIFLCLFLFDDAALRRVIPESMHRLLTGTWLRPGAAWRTRGLVIWVIAPVIFVISILQITSLANVYQPPQALHKPLQWLQPWHVVNSYHVFPTMKTERIELEIQGSMDGSNWQSYEFRYKPGDVSRRPEAVLPHHPRLDWMMWFVEMGHPMNQVWFDGLLRQLAGNSASVTGLLAGNPFPDYAPNFLRVQHWRYRFTSKAEKRETGNWWAREFLGPFGFVGPPHPQQGFLP